MTAEYTPLSRRLALQQQAVNRIADMAAGARALSLLREARAALPAEFYDLACRIDAAIFEAVP